ncbi:ATP-binding protein [Bacteroides helcogenes]|uniref:Helicase HerA central domain-containing protein n=1 Tax=Bacteroides helcogenes (strain ATCC 35417 / DSM 20613 / JCM 6297 / CCUG 15421 / P 36-108) TaxID=693979 RepID=E6SWD9_BACT6|nr:ATP-binding protein [Bacteroides helcogenes]ADV44600.1 hypothetical protein Bache_2647 [Bacteroides helcogenes P 36-108]MDY5238890.1 ATP-binding protein [Bacteroides helcogenes]
MNIDVNSQLQKHSIFRVGEVYSVNGREVCIKVDKNKNLSHLLYKGNVIKNVSVGSYLKILKGFICLVAKVESETIKENYSVNVDYHNKNEEISRLLIIKLIGYFENKEYHKGVKELPLIGNECLLMDNEEFSLIHKFAKDGELTLQLGHLMTDNNVPIEIGINKLFSSHIGIFGNTGSGKSYTLANIYKKLFEKIGNNNKFKDNAKFLLFDFNGEYSGKNVITNNKKVYKLTTRTDNGDKIPLKKEDLLTPQILYILSSATEKTQQPFIQRTLNLYSHIHKDKKDEQEVLNHFKNFFTIQLKSIFSLHDAQKTRQLLNYASNILYEDTHNDIEKGLVADLELYSNGNFKIKGSENDFITDKNIDSKFESLHIKEVLDNYNFSPDFIKNLISFLYLEIITDVLQNTASNEHIIPAINKLKGVMLYFSKVFEISESDDFWDGNNLVVIDLNMVRTDIKKLIPLLLSSKLYNEQKEKKESELSKSLNIIIDEAHNVLSYESMRESESWKDFRLETFEEIIKEGRKFGVFLTIASQRPSDISATIISQLHNYFIHRLINNKDLEMIEKAVSYLDRLSVESLPILPVGACVLSGVIADLPIIIQVDKLDNMHRPQSDNINLLESWIDDDNTELNDKEYYGEK